MDKLRIRAKAISPIHIGSGDSYEPINYVIDDKYLYEFKEEEFFKRLSSKDKKIFLQKVDSKKKDALLELFLFIHSRKSLAKEIAFRKVQLSTGFIKHYNKYFGKITQESKDKSIREFNQFHIERSVYSPNIKSLYIPGSSIKGAINTALIEYFNLDLNDYFNNQYSKEMIISDSFNKSIYEFIGFALNKEKFESDLIGPKKFIEVIFKESIFEFEIKFKKFKDLDFHLSELNENEFIEAINSHYMKNFNQMLGNEEINRVLGRKFKAEFENLKLKPNQFLLRIGKHSGASAVTVERLRKILVKFAQVKGKNLDDKLRKLVKKSSKEPEIIAELAFAEDIFRGRDREIQKIFWDYYEAVDNDESLREDLREGIRDIKGFLEEETTTWLFSFDNKLKENSHLPFGWIICEIL